VALGMANVALAQVAFRNAASSTALSPQSRSDTSATLATPTFRAVSSAATTGATLTIARPAGTVTDDVMIASIGIRPTTATITPPAGWILVTRLDNGSPNANSLVVYLKVAGAAEPASYAFAITGSTHSTGGIQSFFNVDTTDPIDVENGQNTANALNHATPSVTTTVNNAMVVTSHSFASSSSWTAPAGMTESFDIASGVADPVGQTTETARVLQAARGATGVKTAAAASDADVGNAHILVLKPGLEIPQPAGLSLNDVMIASIGVTPSTAVVTAPGGWTLIRRIDNASATSNSLLVFRKVATAAEPANYEWSVSGVDFAVGGIQAFFNVDTAAPLDVEAGQCTPQPACNVATNSHSTPSITTTVPNTMVVTSHTYASSRTWTPPAGMTEAFDQPNGANNATGQSIEGNFVFQGAAGATGAMTATAAGNNDVGNAHILALRSPRPVLTINVPAGTVANDVMIASIAVQPSTTVVTPPAGWTLIRQMNNASATTNSLYVYRRTATGAEPASYTWTPTGLSYAAGGIQTFSGVDTTTPIDVENGAVTASALTHATPSVTTTVANTMLVTSHTFASSANWAPPAGMTEGFEAAALTVPNSNGQAIEGNYVIQAAAGATGVKTATASANADRGNAHILALRPAPIPVTPGSFNAFETSTAANAITGQIFMKIVSTNFAVDVVAILSGAQMATFTNTVQVDLVTGSTGGANCPGTPVTIAGTTQSVNLTNGRGTTGNFNVAAAYPDVRVRIQFPTVSPTVTACSTDNFSIRPTSITVTSSNATNNASSGAPTFKTGANFNLTAASVAGYTGTPAIDNTKVVGSPNAGTIGGTFGAAVAGTGIATGNSFFYSEAGNFGLNANAVYDSTFTAVDQPNDCNAGFSNVLAGGKYGCSFGSVAIAMTVGVSGFGRFIPDNFNVVYNAPSLTTSCAAGAFTYVGQAVPYTTAPQMTLTARSGTLNGLANTTTTNYAGAYMKLSNAAGSSLNQAPYDTQSGRYARFDTLGGGTTPALDTSGLPATTADPTLGAFVSGVGTLTFASGLSFLRSTTTPSAAFNADIALSLNVVDTDGVAFGGNPASFGAASSGNGMAFNNGKQMRFGRLRMQNAAGSSLLDLPLAIETQYYNGTAFARNTADSCTNFAATAIGLSNYTGNLAACETAIQTPAGNVTFSAGVAQSLVMRKPGSTNAGSVDLTANLGAATVVPNTCTAIGAGPITSGPASAANLPYLQGDWGGGALTGNPVSRATFGIYKNASEFIYFRENY
jgi:hypothetical protein